MMHTEPDLLNSLRDARDDLMSISIEEHLEVLAAFVDAWRDPKFLAREKLATELPRVSGFSETMVRAGLEAAFSEWDGQQLYNLIARELDSKAALDPRSSDTALGFPLTALILAGSIPMPTIESLLLPLVVRTSIIAKTASSDPLTAQISLEGLKEISPRHARCIRVIQAASNDLTALSPLFEADCLVAMGSDESLNKIRTRYAVNRRLVTFGHRFSLALIGESISKIKIREKVRCLAKDVALWDQLGCLSPIAVYVLSSKKQYVDDITDNLAEALGEIESCWPRGEISLETASAIAESQSEAEFRSSLNCRVRLLTDRNAKWTVVREIDSRFRTTPLHRFIRIHPLNDVSELCQVLSPMAPHLAAIGLAGLGSSTALVCKQLRMLGTSRLCPIGSMQTPPIGWCHDNRPTLLPLVRLTGSEKVDSWH